MAKQSNVRTDSRNIGTLVVTRFLSHKLMEGVLLFSALGILCVLFSFFVLELQSISQAPFGQSPSSTTPPSHIPPRVESRVIGSQLHIVEVDDMGTILNTFYTSDLSDDIADFTVFAVPQTGYQGFIYVRPIMDGTFPHMKIYPLDVATGSLNPATLNVPADDFILSGDETLIGILHEDTLTLSALEDGALLASGIVPQDWLPFVRNASATLTLSENSCLSLSLMLPPPELSPFPALCP